MSVATNPGTAASALLGGLAPGVRELARLCSLAVRVQPDVLRSVRLAAAPRLPAQTESDLWWSPLAASRTPFAVGFAVPVLHLLREELAGMWRSDPDAVRRARAVIVDRHRTEPPTLRLEEEVAWLALSEGENGARPIEALLDRALVSLVRDRKVGVAHWWPGAWGRLPDIARGTRTAIQLCMITSPELGPDAVEVPEHVSAALDARVEGALRGVPDAAVGVLRSGPVLSLGEVDRGRGAALLAPDTEPRLLEIEWGDVSPQREVVALRAGEVLHRSVGLGAVHVRTGRGTVYDIPLDVATSVAPLPSRGTTPLGATFDGRGTHVAIYSGVATRVELALVDDAGRERRVDLDRSRNDIWRAYLPEVVPGQRYGFRVHGPYDPARGHRCNPAKLLLDPYAKAIEGALDWDHSVYGYRFDDADLRNDADSLGHTMTSVVIDPSFDWGTDRPPGHEYHRTVIYEAHVKGLTRLHPDVPEEVRGTYAGLAHPAVVEHLTRLGVTAVELMPVHQFVQDPVTLERGQREYWGYNSIGFFAPHNDYSATGSRGEQVQEFKQMVKSLHEAGIEVILDVVFNHTGEGNHLGPTLCFRGIDNASYYRLLDDEPAYYFDTTGSGNSPLMRSPHVLQMIMDSLRYWVTEMHVDGFRFDLASTLARELHEVDQLSAFFQLIQQDPVISQVKLIAEPWDLGEGGYQVGAFPSLWTEWNGDYRDTVRDFWRGEPSTLGQFAGRITGSSDLYEHSGRRPVSSINFVSSHDGFTLRDLVSYNDKHNEANGEGNNDGERHNRSWNCGVEGPTDDPEVLALRARQQRNFLATLLLSQGVPMIAHGDEMGRTQHGNNNVYSQDNELAWVDWDLDAEQVALLDFTRRLVALRAEHPVLRRRRFFAAAPQHGGESEIGEIAWFAPSGGHMRDEDWFSSEARSIGVFLNGEAIPEPDARGNPIVDDSFLVLLNADAEAVRFTLPDESYGQRWRRAIDTAPTVTDGDEYGPRTTVPVEGRSILVLVSALDASS